MARATDYHKLLGQIRFNPCGRSELCAVRGRQGNNTASGTVAEVGSIARDKHTLSVTEHDMRRALMRVNTRKAAGPDGKSGRVLKACATQLAPI